jgi:hypothetical protein
MRLRAGDLVKAASIAGAVELTASPAGPATMSHVINILEPKDVALVISLDRHDGRCVYVLGPRGGGWALGAFLVQVVTDTSSQ